MTGVSTSCGACKFLRRKCTSECVFAPYFSYDEAVAHFGAVHKVFGASNVSRLLVHLPEPYRGEAALTISFEAIARMRDPVYGCVAYIYALQQQVANLQEEIEVVGNQVANDLSIANVATNHLCGSSQATNNFNTNLTNNNDLYSLFALSSSSQEDNQTTTFDAIPDIWSTDKQAQVIAPTIHAENNGLSCSNSNSETMMMMMTMMSNHNNDMMMMNLQDSSSYECLWQEQGQNVFGFADTNGSGPHECLVQGLLNQDTSFDYSPPYGSLPNITTY